MGCSFGVADSSANAERRERDRRAASVASGRLALSGQPFAFWRFGTRTSNDSNTSPAITSSADLSGPRLGLRAFLSIGLGPVVSLRLGGEAAWEHLSIGSSSETNWIASGFAGVGFSSP